MRTENELDVDIYTDEDDIFDIINSLQPGLRKVWLKALDEEPGSDLVVYAKHEPAKGTLVHMLLMRFSIRKDDAGLLLIMTHNEQSIYHYFDAMCTQSPQVKLQIKEKEKIVRHLISNAKKI
jgi:hypothetical protein